MYAVGCSKRCMQWLYAVVEPVTKNVSLRVVFFYPFMLPCLYRQSNKYEDVARNICRLYPSYHAPVQ